VIDKKDKNYKKEEAPPAKTAIVRNSDAKEKPVIAPVE